MVRPGPRGRVRLPRAGAGPRRARAARAEATADGLEVVLGAPMAGVAPGQAVVLYIGDRVVGSATIAETGRVP